MFRGPEAPLESLTATGKDHAETSLHHGSHNPAQWIEGEGVQNQIGHLGPPFRQSKLMLMMPEAIRSKSQLIDKEMRFCGMGDFRYPGHGQPAKGGYGVADDHAGVHQFRQG